MPKILLTGGGTAGHVTPNIALIPYLTDQGFDIEYMGSYDGIEKSLIEKENIPYTGIASGKFRRYLSWKNVTDLFRIRKGTGEAKAYMREHRPDVVFSKGGYVTVPVVRAAAKYNIPVVIHESDLSPGLANKMCYSRAKLICYNFPETGEYLKGEKFEGRTFQTGLPIRDELFAGNAEKGKIICDFSDEKPVLLVIGGSLGAAAVNEAVREALPMLQKKFQVAHVCGEGKTDPAYDGKPGYKQFEYVSDELKDLLAMSGIVISRAGANMIWELAALKKPMLLIPLGSAASRGDQILNAESFKKMGFADVLNQDNMTAQTLTDAVNHLYENKDFYIRKLENAAENTAAKEIAAILAEIVKDRGNL